MPRSNYTFDIHLFFEVGPSGRMVTRQEFDDFWNSLTNDEKSYYRRVDLGEEVNRRLGIQH